MTLYAAIAHEYPELGETLAKIAERPWRESLPGDTYDRLKARVHTARVDALVVLICRVYDFDLEAHDILRAELRACIDDPDRAATSPIWAAVLDFNPSQLKWRDLLCSTE